MNNAAILLDDEHKLLSNIPNEGSIGNIRLREKLGWEREKYWDVRAKLLSSNIIGIGSGKGGSVYRISDTVSDVDIPTIASAQISTEESSASNIIPMERKEKEKDYYDAVINFVNIWAQDNGYPPKSFFTCDTSQTQGKKTGKWSRPDVTFICVEKFMYQPMKYLNVISFEVKPPNNVDITSVFETAAHSRFSNKSYLLQFVPEDQTTLENDLERIESECKRFGLGLIICKNTRAEDYESYEEIVEPIHRLPEPREMEKFIKEVVSSAAQSELIMLLK